MIKKWDDPLLNYLPVTDIANKDWYCGCGIIITFHSTKSIESQTMEMKYQKKIKN